MVGEGAAIFVLSRQCTDVDECTGTDMCTGADMCTDVELCADVDMRTDVAMCTSLCPHEKRKYCTYDDKLKLQPD